MKRGDLVVWNDIIWKVLAVKAGYARIEDANGTTHRVNVSALKPYRESQ